MSRSNPENPAGPPDSEALEPKKDERAPVEDQNEADKAPDKAPEKKGEGEEAGASGTADERPAQGEQGEEDGEGKQEEEEERGEEEKDSGEEEPGEDEEEEVESQQRLSFRERMIPKMARFRDSARAVVLVGLAGMAAYLTSVLLAIPVTRLLEPWVAGDPRLTVFRSVIYGALVLDLPKVVAGMIYSFAFGRFMEIRAWASAVGVLLTIYLADLGLSYVIGSFTITWGNRHALMGRLPLALVGFALVVLMALWANRRKQKAFAGASAKGKESKQEEPEDSEGVSPKPPKTLKGVNGGHRDEK